MNHFLFWPRVPPILFLAMAGSALLVSTAAADDIATCAISAWSNDADSNGLNIRAGAGSDAPIIGKIPVGGEISITGSQDGWFRIDHAELVDYDANLTQDVFAGEGWVSGRLLGLLLNDMNLYADPSVDAPVVAHLMGETAGGGAMGPDSFRVDRLLACQDNWVEVEGTFLDEPLRGWATRTCSNQVTTCP